MIETPEQLVMARRIAADAKVGAVPADILAGLWDESPLVRSVLAAIIETQRLDAELSNYIRENDVWTTSGAKTADRITAAIRAGKHYGKDQQ